MNPAIEKLIRPHYLTLAAYSSAGMEADKTQDNLFLNANENPYALPELKSMARYPEPQPQKLLEAFAQGFSNLNANHFCVTRGADEAIQILTRLFCEPHKDAIMISSPAFGMYAVDAQIMPASVIDVPLIEENGDFKLDEAGIIARADDAKLIYICSPNNPTGSYFPAEQIRRICRAVEGKSIVIADEAYVLFACAQPNEENWSMAKFLAEHPNLVVLRTLSKSHALAGARIGCMISTDTDFIQLAQDKGLDAYPLPVPSVDAACKALGPDLADFIWENIGKLVAERARMEKALASSNQVIHVYPSRANFLLVRMKDARGFYDFCTARGIILRDFSAKPATKDCLRFSIGTPEQNDRVLESLKDFEDTIKA